MLSSTDGYAGTDLMHFRQKCIIDVIGVLRLPMQEECWLGLGPLDLSSLSMVEAMKPQTLKLLNHIRVVPPTIPNIPTGIAVEVADDDRLRCGQMRFM